MLVKSTPIILLVISLQDCCEVVKDTQMGKIRLNREEKKHSCISLFASCFTGQQNRAYLHISHNNTHCLSVKF